MTHILGHSNGLAKLPLTKNPPKTRNGLERALDRAPAPAQLGENPVRHSRITLQAQNALHVQAKLFKIHLPLGFASVEQVDGLAIVARAAEAAAAVGGHQPHDDCLCT